MDSSSLETRIPEEQLDLSRMNQRTVAQQVNNPPTARFLFDCFSQRPQHVQNKPIYSVVVTYF